MEKTEKKLRKRQRTFESRRFTHLLEKAREYPPDFQHWNLGDLRWFKKALVDWANHEDSPDLDRTVTDIIRFSVLRGV